MLSEALQFWNYPIDRKVDLVAQVATTKILSRCDPFEKNILLPQPESTFRSPIQNAKIHFSRHGAACPCCCV